MSPGIWISLQDLTSKHLLGNWQGLVNVPFWEYWTSPEKVAIIDHIPNGWVMFNGDMTNDPWLGETPPQVASARYWSREDAAPGQGKTHVKLTGSRGDECLSERRVRKAPWTYIHYREVTYDYMMIIQWWYNNDIWTTRRVSPANDFYKWLKVITAQDLSLAFIVSTAGWNGLLWLGLEQPWFSYWCWT